MDNQNFEIICKDSHRDSRNKISDEEGVCPIAASHAFSRQKTYNSSSTISKISNLFSKNN
jgi:hypothetical protein